MTHAVPPNDRTRIASSPIDELTEFETPLAKPLASVRQSQSVLQGRGNTLPNGTRLHEFEITELVGEGGFGIVYLAFDTSLKRRVALKEYMPNSLAMRTERQQVLVKSERYQETFDAGLKSFINEAQLLASFDHPSLVKVYRFWEQNDTAYMVMPFHEGKNLRDTLRAMPGAPTEDWLRALLTPLTEALVVIHGQDCYHRDIAPDNVMMLAETGRPLLLDFGAARRVIGDMTQALTVILKPGYAPVEQYAEVPGMKQGPWTDVYALGAVVHYAITGRTPPASVGRLMNETYEPLAQVAAGRYTDSFLAAVDRALAVHPESRTQSVEQFRAEIGLCGHASSAPHQAYPSGSSSVIEPAAPPLAAHLLPSISAERAQRPAVQRSQPDGAHLAATAERPRRTRPAAELWAASCAAVAAAAGFGTWLIAAERQPTPSLSVRYGPVVSPTVAASAAMPVLSPAHFDTEREFGRILQAQAMSFGLRAAVPKSELSLAARDQFRFSLTSERDGYLYLIGQSADGSLALLVPNTESGVVRVKRGQPYSFPANDRFVLLAVEPLGISRLLALVSESRRDFSAMAPEVSGIVQTLATGDGAARLLQRWQGEGSMLAGVPQCIEADRVCADEYGAALLSFNVVR